jgi:site-specific DNA recombinase
MNTSNTAAIYLRRSAVDGSGEDISLTYQREACERIAQSQGLEIIHTFNEGDGQSASIFKTNERPEYEAALLGLGKQFGTLIAYSVDRLSRKGMTAVGQMLEVAELQGGRILTNDGLDTDQSSSRLVASFMGELAYAEVKKTSERVTAAKDQKKKRGSYIGGNVPYGYRLLRYVDQPSELVLDQEQAAVIQEMAKRYLDGESFQTIANWLNSQGVPSKRGGQWSKNVVNQILTSSATIGYRRYMVDGQMEDYCNEQGEPVQVAEPAISRAQFQRIQKKVKAKTESMGTHSGRGLVVASTLLGGMMTCAASGVSLSASRRKSRQKDGPTRLRYRCTCGEHPTPNTLFEVDIETHVARQALLFISGLMRAEPDSPILEEVGRRMLAQFTPEQLGRREELQGQLFELESRKSKLMDDYYRDGKISDEDFGRIESQLSVKIDTVTAEIRTLPAQEADLGILHSLVDAGDSSSFDLVGEGSAWAQLGEKVQKSILLALVDEIVVTYVDRNGTGKAPAEWSDMSSRIRMEFASEDNVVELASRTTDKMGRINKIQKKATA